MYKEIKIKNPNFCEYYKEFGCIKDICSCYTLEETKTCTDCKGEFPLSYFPYNKRKCDPCFRENRKIVRQALAERNGCKNYKQYLKLKSIQKAYGSSKNNRSY